MRTTPPLPNGLRMRHLRDGTTVYFAMAGGRRHPLGDQFTAALEQWVRLHHQVDASSSSDTIANLFRYAQSTQPAPEPAARTRHTSELAVLAAFIVENDTRRLDQLPTLKNFIAWYRKDKRPAPADSSVRLVRRAWSAMQRSGLVARECPWPSIDLREPRVKLEAAALIHAVAEEPLKDLLNVLLWGPMDRAESQLQQAAADYIAVLDTTLETAIPLAIEALTAGGRTDLRPAVYQLKVDDLVKLSASPLLALVRPGGHLRLEGQAIARSALKAALDKQRSGDKDSGFASCESSLTLIREAS